MTFSITSRRTPTWAPWGSFGWVALLGLLAAIGVAEVIVTRNATMPAFLFAGTVVGLLVLREPGLGALLFVSLSAAFPRGTLYEDNIPFMGGALKVTDLLLALTIGAWAVHHVVAPERTRLPSRTTTIFVPCFLVAAATTILKAQSDGIALHQSLTELRPLLSYLLIFPAVSALRSYRDALLGVWVCVAAACAAALQILILYAHGEGGTIALYTEGALRIQDTVFLYPLLAVVWAVVVLATTDARLIRCAGAGALAICTAGLFFTYQRGAWLAALTACGVALLLLPWRARGRVLIWVSITSCIGLSLVFATNSVSSVSNGHLLASAESRLASVTSYGSDQSSQYRLTEWSTATGVIAAHPFTGIGLGGTISFTSPMYSPEYGTTGAGFTSWYIHNSYVWLPLKLGVPVAVAFFAWFATRLRLGLGVFFRSADNPIRALALAGSCGIVAVAIAALAGPHLNIDSATPGVASLIALVEALPGMRSEPLELDGR